jgi:hypothetical protein
MALLTALLDKMPAERGPFQAACGRKLAEFLSAIQVFPSSKADSMMSIIRKMMESKEKQVQEAWSDVMIAIVQFMSIEKMETEASHAPQNFQYNCNRYCAGSLISVVGIISVIVILISCSSLIACT